MTKGAKGMDLKHDLDVKVEFVEFPANGKPYSREQMPQFYNQSFKDSPP